MKPIVIRRFLRMPLYESLLCLLALCLLVPLLIIGILEKSLGAIFLSSLLLSGIAFTWGIFFSYGIKITPKRVILAEQHLWKRFRYDEVRRITVIFENNCIHGEIKTVTNERVAFSFNGLDFSRAHSLFPLLHITGLKLSKTFVETSIQKLSACDKVRIQNLYDQNS